MQQPAFGRGNFINCVVGQLTARGFGSKRIKEITYRYEGLIDQYNAQGMVADAEVLAMTRLFGEMAQETQAKVRMFASNLSKASLIKDRIYSDVSTNLFKSDKKATPARAAISLIEDDARFSGLSYRTDRDAARGRLWAAMGDVLDKIGKGKFGIQQGKAHFDNVVREVHGEKTGDVAAAEIAVAWRKTQELSVDMINLAGGAVRKLKDWQLPQRASTVKINRAGFEAWRDNQMQWLDWGRMHWPNGEPIAPVDREGILLEVFKTLQTNGANKIKPGTFNGRGAAVGNMLDSHRFLFYKDAASWKANHEAYGDGNLFDVMASHIEDMAHKVALIQTWGSNPQHMADTARAWAMKRAADITNSDLSPSKDRTLVSRTEAELKNRFEPMFEVMTRANPMDPESFTGNAIIGASHILTAAQLGSASLLVLPGDFVTRLAVKMFNNVDTGPFAGTSYYLKAIATDPKFSRQIAAQSGLVFDDVVNLNYSAARFTGINAAGPAITQRLSDVVMRASLMSGHTNAAQWSVQAELMGMFARDIGKDFHSLPYTPMLRRYGIDEADWRAFTAMAPYRPRSGDALFLRPIDLFKAGLSEERANDLYRRFQGLLLEEARRSVPESTIEGAVALKNTSRPDTLTGAILHSFAMYKNFPISLHMIYGRLALSSPNVKGRLGLIAGLGVGMTLVGALGTQLREISRGKDPLPMNTSGFWGKAMLSGGGMGIWGDFLFQGVNQRDRGLVETIAGPLGEFGQDTLQLALGDTFTWADHVGGLDGSKEWRSTTATRAIEYARRYTPGTSLWWARKALEAQVFDRLKELADPRGFHRQQRRRQRRQRELFGNDYWWQGMAPSRAPDFSGVIQ